MTRELRRFAVIAGVICLLLGLAEFALGSGSVPGVGAGDASADSRSRFAGDLAAARAELAAAPFDLILLDMHLPDGHGLARELAAQSRPKRPIIIALTASVLPEQQDTVRAAGCDDFLGKPYRPQQGVVPLSATAAD
jgi:CheY-like chemotaxis protein